MDKIHETIAYIVISVKALFTDFSYKCFLTVLYLVYTFLFDVSHEKAIAAVITLIVFDFLTGISAAKYSGEEIKSAKVFRSAIKVVVYLTLIAGAHLIEVAGPAITAADDAVIAFLASTELVSLMENVGRMGFAVPKKWLNKLQRFRDSE